jgi:hypothetical protein
MLREPFTNTGEEYTDILQALFEVLDKVNHLFP